MVYIRLVELYTGNHNYMKRKFLSKGYKSFCPDRKGFTFIITIQLLIARNKSSSKYIADVTFYPFIYHFDKSNCKSDLKPIILISIE